MLNPSPTSSATPELSATSTSHPPTKTPVPTPTHTLVPTQTNTSAPTLSPTPELTSTPIPPKIPVGSSLRGDFNDGLITFEVSADGKYVRNMKIVLRRSMECTDGRRLGTDVRLYVTYGIPINKYGFPTVFGALSLTGWFSDPRSAAGTITLNGLIVEGRAKPCSLGPVNWTAYLSGG